MTKQKKYKIIFVDIDCTILNHKIHDWDYESIEALKKAQENGMKFYATTYAVSEILSHLERCLLFKSYMIANNASSWIGDVPLLYSAFIENCIYELTFDEWVMSIRGNSDYIDNIENFLDEEFGISVLNIISDNKIAF